MNNKYIIKVEHPLVRPGLTIETEASECYVLEVTNKLMEIVRDLNRDNGSTTKTFVTTSDGMKEIDKGLFRGDPDN